MAKQDKQNDEDAAVWDVHTEDKGTSQAKRDEAAEESWNELLVNPEFKEWWERNKKSASKPQEAKLAVCSFCGKDQTKVPRLISGPFRVYICNECVDAAVAVLSQAKEQAFSSALRAVFNATVELPERSQNIIAARIHEAMAELIYEEVENEAKPETPQKTEALRYAMTIVWSEEDQCYLVQLPEWAAHIQNSSKATHGDTYEEAARNGREVLEMLLEGAVKSGERIPEPLVWTKEDQESEDKWDKLFASPESQADMAKQGRQVSEEEPSKSGQRLSVRVDWSEEHEAFLVKVRPSEQGNDNRRKVDEARGKPQTGKRLMDMAGKFTEEPGPLESSLPPVAHQFYTIVSLASRGLTHATDDPESVVGDTWKLAEEVKVAASKLVDMCEEQAKAELGRAVNEEAVANASQALQRLAETIQVKQQEDKDSDG